MEEIREFCFKDLPPSVYSETFLPSGIPVILLITPKEVYASCDNFCPVNMGLHNKCPKNWTHDAIHSFYQMTEGVYFL